jgi:ferredoxin, 2Fe-2S
MPMLTILPSGQTLDAATGTSVLETLLGAEIGILHKCDGQAKCGSCHIFVHDGRKTLSKIGRVENERLDQIVGVGSKSRLACQAKIGAENVTIEILGFGSGL